MPRWPTEPILPTGRLADPKFVTNGFDPTTITYPKHPRTASPWARHIELCRQNPAIWNPATQKYDGGWALVSEVLKGGPRARTRRIMTDKQNVKSYIERYWPLEMWQLRQITIPETWCDKQLYIRYLGTMTPEELVLKKKASRERYEENRLKAAENKRIRAQKARERAAKEEVANRAIIRARGRRRG